MGALQSLFGETTAEVTTETAEEPERKKYHTVHVIHSTRAAINMKTTQKR